MICFVTEIILNSSLRTVIGKWVKRFSSVINFKDLKLTNPSKEISVILIVTVITNTIFYPDNFCSRFLKETNFIIFEMIGHNHGCVNWELV